MSLVRQVSIRQLEMLIEYMEQHTDLALGRVRSKEGRALSLRLWTQLAAKLNSESSNNTYRTPKEWSKFYNDYKCRVKNKARKLAQSQQKTGGGPADAPALSLLEERLCAVLGPDKFQALPVQQNPLHVLNDQNNQDDYFDNQNNIDQPITEFQNTIPSSIPETELNSMSFVEIETVAQIHNIEQRSNNSIENTPYLVDTIVIENTSPNQDTIEIEQPSRSNKENHPKRKKKCNSPKQSKAENDIEQTKNMLAEIERAKLELNEAQIQAQLERNTIEKQKVDAINDLAQAAWALVSVFKAEPRSTSKRVRSAINSEDETP